MLKIMKKLLIALLTVSLITPSFAQKGIALVRDAETEELLRDYTRPILRAAKVEVNAVNIHLVADPGFNAFVASGRRIFINTGALTMSKTPNQIIGVLAHETGHIAGGHLARMRQSLENAQTLMIIGMLLAGAGVAGAAVSGQRDIGAGAAGAITAPMELARRSLLAYQRGEESAADRSALDYLNATGQSSKGMIETFERFASDQLFSARGVSSYTVSHPMPNDRIANLRELAEKSPHFNTKDPAALQHRHDLMRAKLIGFTGRADTVSRTYPMSDQSIYAKYARAISFYRNGNSPEGVRLTDQLIAANPQNPYFHELKGQILLEFGKPAEALASLRKAVSMKPGSTLIRGMLGHALIANDKTDEGIKELLQAVSRDNDNVDAYKQLAIGYGKKGMTAHADLATAQAAFSSGEYRTARQIATRAKKGLPENSSYWIKADEIETFKPPNQG
jgi:predicted Zn-dependent protease